MNSENKFFGICRFCGQIAAGTIEGAETQEQADKKATMNCGCSDARELQKKRNRKRTQRQISKNFLFLTTKLLKVYRMRA